MVKNKKCGINTNDNILIYVKLKTLLFEVLADHGLLAAIMLSNGEIFTGKNHAECVMKINDKYPDFKFDVDDLADIGENTPEDGFWDIQRKEFISREEAFKLVNGDDGDGSDADFGDELHSGDA